MNKEAYVSFEVAKLLKENGFDWPCICYYEDNGIIHRALDYVRQNDGDDDDNDECICPTQQMACRWLRKEKGIHILPEISEVKENPKYYCMIWKTSTLESFIIELFDSYEDAIEAALEYVLTNLI